MDKPLTITVTEEKGIKIAEIEEKSIERAKSDFCEDHNISELDLENQLFPCFIDLQKILQQSPKEGVFNDFKAGVELLRSILVFFNAHDDLRAYILTEIIEEIFEAGYKCGQKSPK